MEEEKSKKGLYIGIIIFLVLCLAGSGFFIYKRIYQEPKKEEPKQEEKNEKIEIPNLSNILKMIPVKLDNDEYVGYNVSELTDKEINKTIIEYIVNNSEMITKDDESYYIEKESSIKDYLFIFLGLKDYLINYNENDIDIRYNFEKVTENDVDYVKIKLTFPGTDAFDTFELQDLNNTTYDKDNNIYIINTLVIRHMGGGPDFKIGKANVYLKENNKKYTLEKVEFEKYSENDPIE